MDGENPMKQSMKVLLMSFVLLGIMTIGAYAAADHEGVHNHNPMPGTPPGNSSQLPINSSQTKAVSHDGHENTQSKIQEKSAVESNHGDHANHGNTKENQGPDWPVLYGFAGVNLAILAVAGIKKYILKDRTEVTANAD